jgi:hypothetical protein
MDFSDTVATISTPTSAHNVRENTCYNVRDNIGDNVCDVIHYNIHHHSLSNDIFLAGEIKEIDAAVHGREKFLISSTLQSS